MGYYLLDNRNPHGRHFYTTRRAGVRAIVLHITAGLEDEDLRGVDRSAENTARYAANTSRSVSWHRGVDSDSQIALLPDEYTAWHCAGFNSPSLGLEISKADTDWSSSPTRWVHATLANAAVVCRAWERKFNIPQRLLSRANALSGHKGYVYHSTMDPRRRTDPGADFPIRMLWSLVSGAKPQSWTEESSMAAIIVPDSREHLIRKMQNQLDWVATHVLDESYRSDKQKGVKVDGDWGPNTSAALRAVRSYYKTWPRGAQEFDPWLLDDIRLHQDRMRRQKDKEKAS